MKVTVSRELLWQVLDAACSPYCAQDLGKLVPAIKAALDAPAERTVQEPECYKWEEYCKWAKGWGWDTCESEYDPRLPEYAKYHEGTDFDGPNVRNFRALYTAPQAQQPAPPADVPMLTDEELSAIYKQANGEDVGKAQPLTTQRIFKAMRAASVRQKAGLP